MEKTYLGDGVYAYFDGFHIVLETNRGSHIDQIYLEDSVINSLFKLVEKSFKCRIKVERAQDEQIEINEET